MDIFQNSNIYLIFTGLFLQIGRRKKQAYTEGLKVFQRQQQTRAENFAQCLFVDVEYNGISLNSVAIKIDMSEKKLTHGQLGMVQ